VAPELLKVQHMSGKLCSVDFTAVTDLADVRILAKDTVEIAVTEENSP
jgi:hypothetical protein